MDAERPSLELRDSPRCARRDVEKRAEAYRLRNRDLQRAKSASAELHWACCGAVALAHVASWAGASRGARLLDSLTADGEAVSAMQWKYQSAVPITFFTKLRALKTRSGLSQSLIVKRTWRLGCAWAGAVIAGVWCGVGHVYNSGAAQPEVCRLLFDCEDCRPGGFQLVLRERP